MIRSAMHRALDRTVVFSFDRTGYLRHARGFPDQGERELDGSALITGGTAGIGLAAVQGLAERGSPTLLWGRSVERGEKAAAAVLGARFTSVDLADLQGVSAAAEKVEGPLHTIVLNAGAMPLERTLSPQGHELVWASQVLGHLLLLRVLRRRGLLTSDTRVVWVSSGGMYTQRLDLRDLRADGAYQRHTVYANAKRAQVMLARHLAERWPEPLSASMHPGWVDTAAVRHSMPVFRAFTAPILRSAEQGADTIVWLATTAERPETGRFWFDRATQPEHMTARTQASNDDLRPLVDHVFSATDPYL